MNRISHSLEGLVLNLHPERYHGQGKRPPFFEGWYFKLIDAAEQERYAIIPGVSLAQQGLGPHAFIQIFDGVRGTAAYVVYPLGEFWAATNAFTVHIGPNRFTREALTLDITEGPLQVQGHLRFTDSVAWPVTLTTPGIMGWYAWVPFMECYHGVLSLDHVIQGALTINGVAHDFTAGRGYIEKDWGQAFPSAWVWQQSNHFDEPGVSLTASIAMIPWVRHSFRGFIVGLWRQGTLYRFATYTGAVTESLEIAPDRVHWILSDRLYRLEMYSRRTNATPLRAPSRSDMERRVPETLSALIDVRLTARCNGALLFEGSGRNAGLEIAGDLETLTA